jgi:hypothetical protein
MASPGRERHYSREMIVNEVAQSTAGADDGDAARAYRQHTLYDFWTEYRKHASWADRSLLLFTPSSLPRKLAISLTHAREWRFIVNVMILVNCVSMMLVDPVDKETDFNSL